MFEITRSTFTLFGFTLHWYGVLITLGVLGALMQALLREKRLGLEKDTSINLALVCVPAGIICARIYYVAFSWDYYATHPEQILDIRGGGIAIYGAVIGGVLAGWIYSRVKKLPFGSLADLVAPGLAMAQALGRWGNFLNREAYGALVTNPDLHFFPVSVWIENSGWHYATFFYESMWCALIGILLFIGESKRFFKKRGDMFLSYAFLYALERSLVEGLRADSLYIGPMRVSQLLSLAILMATAIVLVLRAKGLPAWKRASLPATVLMTGIALALDYGILAVACALLCLAVTLFFYNKYVQIER